jgi:uncharacterized protein (DUF2344 family)
METKQNELTEQIKKYHNRLAEAEILIDELVNLGVDYNFFMNAKNSHKKLKEIQKAIRQVR